MSVVAGFGNPYRLPMSYSEPPPYVYPLYQQSQPYRPHSYPFVYPPMQYAAPMPLAHSYMQLPDAYPFPMSPMSMSASVSELPRAVPKPAPVEGVPAGRRPKLKHDQGANPAEVKAEGKEEAKNKPASAPTKPKSSNASTYKHRNVYKSVIRHMYSYIRKQRNEVVVILQAAGFPMRDVEHSFYEIGCYNDMERQKGKKKISQSLVKKIATDKSIYTYILRETLHLMLKSWDSGKFGRLTNKNVTTYKDVCQKYYNETVRVLGGPAQGSSTSP